MNIIANMNAGYIPKEHWVNDIEVGGGRIIGEACHLIDICVFLTQSKVSQICTNGLGQDLNLNVDNVSILLRKFQNGSNAVINYFSNGSTSYAKERIEVYRGNCTWIVENYKKSLGYGIKSFKTFKTGIDKGHKAQMELLIDHIKNSKGPLIKIDEILNVSDASISALESVQERRWINVREY